MNGLCGCMQFHDICFGGAPAMGHQQPALLDEFFPSFELRFADVSTSPFCMCSVRACLLIGLRLS